MKKLLILILGATLILSLVGCTSKITNLNNKQTKIDDPTVKNIGRKIEEIGRKFY